jgi:hypothetical protein
MHTGFREEIDGDLSENYVSISDYKTEQHQHEIICSVCCKTFFANKATHDNICRVIEQGLDNPFLCDDCQQEYDELAYEAR